MTKFQVFQVGSEPCYIMVQHKVVRVVYLDEMDHSIFEEHQVHVSSSHCIIVLGHEHQ